MTELGALRTRILPLVTRKQDEPKLVSEPESDKGEITSSGCYRMPILRALVALGGKASSSQVLSRVYDELEVFLTERDKRPGRGATPSQVWRQQANNACSVLRQKGLMEKSVVKGTWEITDLGRKAAEKDRAGA